MLTPEQIAYFETFGFIIRKQLLSPEEMESVTREADELFAEDLRDSGDAGLHQSVVPFVEKSARLTELVDSDRIYGTVEDLMGPDFRWSGSEGNKGPINERREHAWHADRPGTREAAYPRLKIMIYLEPTTRDSGALRVIPGSHRCPFHEHLQPLQAQHHVDGTADGVFGVDGPDIPAYPIESTPGDVVFFHHSLFHAVYGAFDERRYITCKYVAKPQTDEHLASLWRWSPYAFELDEAFTTSGSPRILRMVEGMAELAPAARAAAAAAAGS